MMNDNKLKPKFLHRLLGNLPQLMLGHFSMRFVFDSFEFVSIFKFPHDSPKIDHRSCTAIMILRWYLKRRFSQ